MLAGNVLQVLPRVCTGCQFSTGMNFSTSVTPTAMADRTRTHTRGFFDELARPSDRFLQQAKYFCPVSELLPSADRVDCSLSSALFFFFLFCVRRRPEIERVLVRVLLTADARQFTRGSIVQAR